MSTYTERIRKSREAQNGVHTGSTYTERQTIKRLNSGTDTLFDDYKAVADSHNTTLNGIKSYSDMSAYKPSGGFDYDSLTANAQSRKLLSDRLKRYRSAYANAYGEGKIQKLENSLKQIKTSQDSIRQVVDGIDKFRSQFKNEDEYSRYLTEQKKASDYDTLSKMSEDDIANALENGSKDIDSDNIKAYIKYKGSGKLLDAYQKYIESNKNTPTAVTVWNGLIPTEQVIVDNSDEQKQELAELERLRPLRHDSEYAEKLYKEYSALPDWEENKTLTAENELQNTVTNGVWHNKYDILSEAADDGYIGSEKIKELYSYIYNTQGEDNAHEFFEGISRLNNYRGAVNEEQAVRSFADEFPILSSIASVPAQLMNGLTFTPLADAIDTAFGVPIDTNDTRHSLSRIVSASRDEVGGNIDNDVGRFLYNTANSAIDSAVSILVAKGLSNGTALEKYVPEVTSALMGNQVATNAIIEGKEKGYSDEKAVALGIIQGSIEGITEKYSIEAILKEPKTAFRGFLKAFAAEGSEEVTANWLNRIVDGVANGDQSDFEKAVRKYLKDNPNASQEEALAHAVLDNIGEDALSFLAGGISGAAMFGSVQGYSKIQQTADNRHRGKAVKNLSNENQLIKLALQQDENSKAYRLAKKYKADSKKSAVKLGAVQSALAQQVYDNKINALPSAVENRFAELGVNSSDYLTRAVVRILTGEPTNKFDDQLIRNTPQAQRIISEYQNADSGEYTAKWVQELDNGGLYKQISEFSQKPLTAYQRRVVSTLPNAQQKARENVQTTGNTQTTVNGKAAEIAEIQGVEGGVVTYLMTDGSTQTSDSIDFSDGAAVLDAYASAMSEEEAKAYYQNYKGGDVDTYTMEWNAARICGMAHLPERMSESSLTPEQFTAAYKIGVLQKADETERRQKAVDNAVIRFNEGGGIYRQGSVKTSGIRHLNGNLTARQEQSLRAITDIANVLGVDVEVFASKTKDGRFVGKNGSFDPDTGKIMIDINAGANEISRLVTDSAMMRTFSHELTHYIQAYSPKQYEELKAYVLDTLTEQGQNIEQLAKEKIARSQNEMSHEKAVDEIIADGCEMMLKDSKAVNEIAKKHRSLAKKIKQFIGEFIEKIKKAFDGVKPHSKEAIAIANSIEDLKHIQSMWDKALINAAEAYQAQKQAQKNTAVNTAEQMSDRGNIMQAEFERHSDITQSLQFLRWFGDWQNKPGRASKVVDENGKPLIVYHQTNEEFSVFDTNKPGAGQYDTETPNGIFLKPSDSDIGVKGNIQMPLYANIRKPFKVPNRQKLVEHYRKHINGYAEHKDNLTSIDKEYERKYEIAVQNDDKEYSRLSTALKEHRITQEEYTEALENSQEEQLVREWENATNTEAAKLKQLVTDYFKNSKYDGIIIEKDEGSFGRSTKTFIAFENTQVKSATGNIGTFSESDPDIYHSDRDIDDRAILAYALRNISRDSAEYRRYSRYIDQLDNIEDLEEWLDDVESQIYDEYRKPVPDKAHLKALQKTKRNIRTEIAELDKGLLDLEAAKPLRDLLATEKEKIRHSESEKYKQKLQEKLNDVKESRQRERERRRERRKVKEYKEKIRKVCNRFGAMITRRNADTALPVALVEEIASLSDIIDAGLTRNGNPVSGYSKFRKLKDIYDTLKSHDYKTDDETGKFDKNIYTQAYAEEISRTIEQLAEELGDRAINQLDGTQLERVYNLLRIIENNLTQARQVLINGQWQDIHETGESVLKEMQKQAGVKNRKGQRDMLKAAYEQYAQWTLSPTRYAKHITGYDENSALLPFFKALEEAEGKAVSIRREGLEIFDDIVKMFPKRFDSFTGRKAEFLDFGITDRNTGETVRITPAMAISIYRQAQNKSNRRAFMELYDENGEHIPHVMGGLKIPSEENYKAGKTDETDHTVIISQKSLNKIKRYIDNDEFMSLMSDAAYEFFNVFSTKHLNNTSIQLYGIPISIKEEYFPIRRDQNFIGKDAEALVRDFTLENSGFTKERVQSATPICLEDVNDVIMRHLDGITKYAALTVPIRNFNKIYNYKAKGMKTSLRESIEQTWGKSANAYIDKMLTDLQSPPKSDHPLFAKLRGNFARAVLSMNISVTMKQAASYPTAAAVLGWKPLLKALRTDGNSAIKPIYRADTAEIDEITDLYWDRTENPKNIYDYTDEAQKTFLQNLDRKAPLLMKWIEKADVATVGRLFKASQFYVEDQFPELQKGSDEYKAKLKEVYEEVIRTTQPIYSTMNRPGILRTNNNLIKSITMFMTQRLQNTGILFEATGNLKAKISAAHQNPTAENKAALRQARRQFIHSVTALGISNAVLALMTLLYNAVMGTMDKYRDDEGEVTAQAVLSKLGWDFAETAVGNLLFGSEIYTETEKLIEALSGESSFYSESIFEVNVFDNLNKGIDDIVKIARCVSKAMSGNPTEEESEKYSAQILKASEDFLFAALQPLGVPMNNIKKIIKGIKNNGHDLWEGEWGSFKAGSKVDLKAKDYAEVIYNNILKGDKSRAAELFNQAINKGFESKKLWDSLARVLMNDKTLIAAAEAKFTADEETYIEKIKVLKALGFKDTVLDKAIKFYNNKYHPEEKPKKAEEKRTYSQGELFD